MPLAPVDDEYLNDPNKLLALCVWREARSEKLDAKIGVVWTILNRCHVKGQGFAPNVTGNILKPWAFSSFMEGDPNSTKYPEPTDHSWIESMQAVDGPGISDPIFGAVFYYSPPLTAPPVKKDGSCAWGNVEHTVTIGALNFYKIAQP